MLPQWLLEVTSILKDLFVAFSAVAGVVTAIVGFRQWRRELMGKEKFRIARKIAVLSLQFRDEFLRARSPLTFSGECATRQRDDNESPTETQLLDEWFARRKRLESLQQSLRMLRATSWEAEVVLNKDISKLLRPLEQAFTELWGAVEAYFSTQIERARSNQRNLNLDDWLKSQHALIYGIDRQPAEKIEAAVNAILKELRAFVK